VREEAQAAVAEAPGRGGKAVDGLAGQERALQRLCGEAVGGFLGALRQQTDCPDRGFLRPCTLAREVEGRQHVLTQGPHEISPFVRHVIGVRRKTSERDSGRQRGLQTAACAAYLNLALEPTRNSLRSSLATAVTRGSPRALGAPCGFLSLGTSVVCPRSLRGQTREEEGSVAHTPTSHDERRSPGGSHPLHAGADGSFWEVMYAGSLHS